MARYTPLSVDWKHEVLEEGVARVDGFLERERIEITKFLVMDVVIPCYRCDVRILRGIVSLAIPEDSSTQVSFNTFCLLKLRMMWRYRHVERREESMSVTKVVEFKERKIE